MDWKIWAERGKSAYEKYKQGKSAYKSAKKASEYLKLVRNSFNEDDGSASLFKLGIKVSMDLASKLLGTSLTSHPYFQYHKVHIEALAGALKAIDTKSNAEAALESAIRSSDSAQQLAGQISSYESRQKFLIQRFAAINFLILGIARDVRNGAPGALEQVRSANNTPENIERQANDLIYEYRCCWAGLTDEVLEALLMVKGDFVATQGAMKRFDEKIRKLETGRGFFGALGRIASHTVSEQRMLRALDEGPQRERTIMDPVTPAKTAWERMNRVATSVCRANDAVFDDALIFGDPRKLLSQLSERN